MILYLTSNCNYNYPHRGQNVLFQGLFPRYWTRKSYMLGSFALNWSLLVGATLSGALASKKPWVASNSIDAIFWLKKALGFWLDISLDN